VIKVELRSFFTMIETTEEKTKGMETYQLMSSEEGRRKTSLGLDSNQEKRRMPSSGSDLRGGRAGSRRSSKSEKKKREER